MQVLYTIWFIISTLSVIFTVTFIYFFIKNVRTEIDIVKGVNTFKATVKLVYVEQVGNMYLMYDKINNHYICQAATEQELWEIAKNKFPNMQVLAMTQDAEIKKA
jgi:hypothetical protein